MITAHCFNQTGTHNFAPNVFSRKFIDLNRLVDENQMQTAATFATILCKQCVYFHFGFGFYLFFIFWNRRFSVSETVQFGFSFVWRKTMDTDSHSSTSQRCDENYGKIFFDFNFTLKIVQKRSREQLEMAKLTNSTWFQRRRNQYGDDGDFKKRKRITFMLRILFSFNVAPCLNTN